MKNIVSPLRRGMPLVNDYMMNHLIKTKFGADKKVINRPFLKHQICKAMQQNIVWCNGGKLLPTITPHKRKE